MNRGQQTVVPVEEVPEEDVPVEEVDAYRRAH
jgi:hypothetical protein